MILSDREIQAAIERGAIRFVDPPTPDDPRWTSTAVDLTLDVEIRPWYSIPDSGRDVIIDPFAPNFNANALINSHTQPEDCTQGFLLRPGRFVLGWTREKVGLPHSSRLAARVEGKSSLARMGVGIHVTAPTIHAGFGVNPDDPNYQGSPIRLEIWNIGPLVIRLTKGMAICQLIIEEVHGTPNRGYSGQFRIQGPQPISRSSPKRKRR